MIGLMRRYRRLLQIGLLVVIAAFVITSVWVGARQSGGRADAIATVNGEEIPAERYQRRYRLYFDFYAQANRGRLTPEVAEAMGLPQMVVDDLVRETVTVQRAQAEDLAINDDEFNAEVHAIPDFQEGGRFSMARYRRFLAERGTDAEDDLRRQMTVRKMQRLIAGAAKVTDAELEQAFRLRREEVTATWAFVELAPLVAAVRVSDDEAEAYLKAHGAEFQQPERRRIQYVTLAPRDFKPSVSDVDVHRYYDAHANEFETPRQVHAAHILVRVPQTGGSEAEDRARAKAADAIRRAKGGEDFARLAMDVSEDDATKQRGGDLGWVAKGETVPEFEQAVFALKRGDVTPAPVRTPFGFHAIKAIDVREGGKKSLKDVAAQIRDRLAADAAEASARAKADEVRPPLQAAKDFTAEARRLGLVPVETPLARLPRSALAGPDHLVETAFALATGGVSTPVKTPAGYVIVKAYETIPAGVPPFAEIRDKVIVAVQRQKADKMAQERAQALATDARASDLVAVATKAGTATGLARHFSRAKPAERLPGDVQVAALQAPAGQVLDPVKTPQGYYVVKVLERKAPSAADLGGDRDQLTRELLAQKRSAAWETWIAAAMANAKIERLARAAPARRRG